jgi:hypothetical protein
MKYPSKKSEKRIVHCEKCSRDIVVTDDSVVSGICHRCLLQMEMNIDPDLKKIFEIKPIDPFAGYPGQWQKMELYVDEAGNVNRFGKRIDKEFGKFKPTTADELFNWHTNLANGASKFEKKKEKEKKNLDKKIAQYKKSKLEKARKKKNIKK